MTPNQIEAETPGDLMVMLEGVDWASDRAFERAIFVRTDSPRDLLDRGIYPRFRAGEQGEATDEDYERRIEELKAERRKTFG